MSQSHSRSRGSTIELTSRAREHDLFPLLDYLVKTSSAQWRQIEAIDRKVSKVDGECSKIMEVQRELKELLQQFGESTFDIEKCDYKVI